MIRKVTITAIAALLANSAYGADPSNDEQLWLELVNRMRLKPAQELSILANINPGSPASWQTPRSSDPDVALALSYFNVNADVLQTQWGALTPAPPLAWNSNLNNSAAAHNMQMIVYDMQSHQLPGEQDLGKRLTNAGYSGWNIVGENIYAYTESVFQGHAGFAIDWGPTATGIQNPPGHRENLMDTGFREIGISITPESDPSTSVGPLVVTQDLGGRPNFTFLTGVVIGETGSGDAFYTPGEGLGSMGLRVYQAGTKTEVGSTKTYASGGYALKMAAGNYDLEFTGLKSGLILNNIAFGSDNLKVDVISITGGTQITADAGTTGVQTAAMLVNDANVSFLTSQHLLALQIKSSNVKLSQGGSKLIYTKSLKVDDQSVLDLADNELVLQATAGTRIEALKDTTELIASARNGALARWAGFGLTSSTAANGSGNTGLAIMANDNGSGVPVYTTFGNQPVDKNSVLVKYTYVGDADLNGSVDADDYFQIDRGFSADLDGYSNGDFDYNGTIDADDYFAIDSAFLNQNGPLGFVATIQAVPEPKALVIFLGLGLALRRRLSR